LLLLLLLLLQVREFVEKAFRHVGIEVDWQGERGSVDEVREGRQGALQ